MPSLVVTFVFLANRTPFEYLVKHRYGSVIGYGIGRYNTRVCSVPYSGQAFANVCCSEVSKL
jgi:hypothetical protein